MRGFLYITRLSRLQVRAPPRSRSSPAGTRRYIQMKLTEEKYSFQVKKEMTTEPRHQAATRQSSRQTQKWYDTQSQANDIQQEDNAERKVRSAMTIAKPSGLRGDNKQTERPSAAQ